MGRLSGVEIIDSDGHHHVPDPVVIDIGERLLNVYISLRQVYVPGPVHISGKNLIHFYRAAEKCFIGGVSPEKYVHDQLERMARVGKFWHSMIDADLPEICADHNLLWLKSYNHYKSQLDVFNTMSKIYGPRPVLEDPTIQLTPLIKALIALDLGYADIVELHREAALAELDMNKTAKDLFSEIAERLNAR
jgi:hypothetical protein